MQQIVVQSTAPSRSLASNKLVRKASLLDTLALMINVILPTLAKGVIVRRPWTLRISEGLNLDRRAIRQLQRIHQKYGEGPLLLRFPMRSFAVVLAPEQVHRVLEQSPDPFTPATREKTATLAHFEPKGVLISQGEDRTERRSYNEEILDSRTQAHRLANHFLHVIDAEVAQVCGKLGSPGELNWEAFSDAWFRIVRLIVLGEGARNDDELSGLMAKLRSQANWAFLAPQRPALRDRLLRRIESYIAAADPNSLAGIMACTPASARTVPAQQVPQWLFAFDAAGMTTFRALGLLATHRDYARLVRHEIEDKQGSARQQLPYTRAAVLESLRLWPTTPLLLRETTNETAWPEGVLPKNTGIVIFTPFFHRDDERFPDIADRFRPEIWHDPGQQRAWPLIPFSEGPAVCPGRNLVLLLAPAMIAAILDNVRLKLKDQERLRADRPLPGTLNPFTLRFEVAPKLTAPESPA